MLTKELKSLIDKYCMGKEPTDAQLDQIMDLSISLNADSLEVANYIEEKQNGPTQEELDRIAKEEAERKAKAEALRKAKEEAERKAKEETERKTKAEAERKAKEEAERKAKAEADRKAKEEAERKAKEQAEAPADKKAQAAAKRKATMQRKAQAKEWFEKAEKLYRNAKKKDAVECYRQAVELGHVDAAYKLGECYRYGEGVKENTAEAI